MRLKLGQKLIDRIRGKKEKIIQIINLYPERLGVGCIENWPGYNFKEYFIKKNIPERIKQLLKNLDEESIKVINQKIEHFLNLPLDGSIYESSCRFSSRDILYTEEQLKENQDFIAALPKLKEKYKGDFGVMVPEVFYYHHGLKFLSKSELEYIKNKDFIDLGAFWGDSSIVLNEYYPRNIYAFEIIPSAKDKYYNNIKANNIDIKKFHFINAGVSDKDSKLLIDTNFTRSNLSNLGDTEIDIIKLDNYFRNNNEVGLIKMDIEGAEYNAVLGALELIKRNHPILLITIYYTP